jgi:hypothetical protein
MGATALAFDWLRPHLWPVETVAAKDDFPDWSGTTVEMGAVTADGRHVADSACWDGACRGQDVVAFYVDFHPDSHFLPLQLVETGVVLALAALAVTVSFQLLRRGTGAAA